MIEPSLPPPPPRDEELISNILPLYHMFQSTISKHLRPLNENFADEPPLYEFLPVLLGTATPATPGSGAITPLTPFALSAVVSPAEPGIATMDELFFPPMEDTPNQSYEDTILANIHKLPNLSKRDSKVSNSLEISINFTKAVCQIGEKSTLINASDYEYSQGDFIHGYVTIVNKLAEPIPFDMVYVCFEGTIVVLENKRGLIDTESPSTVYKFLSTLDLFALWTFANIDRLATDKGDPYDWCPGETDPCDGTQLSIDAKRLLQPGAVYKRMFTFRVPEKLLDNACAPHLFPLHTELPPTLGITRHLIPPSVILASKDAQTRDFGFTDTSVSYLVDCRIIGRALDYKYNCEHDQYVVAQEKLAPVRVIPKKNLELVYMRAQLEEEARIFYKALVDLIREKIRVGEEIVQFPAKRRLAWLLDPRNRELSATKFRQLYEVAGSQIKRNVLAQRGKSGSEASYSYMAALKKKLLTGLSKVLGVVSISTPKQGYYVTYVAPQKFRDTKGSTSMTIPIEVSFVPEEKGRSPPEIKLVGCDIMVMTVRLKKHPLPFEIVHDMCFNDEEIDSKRREVETFDELVIKQFSDFSQQLAQLIKAVGNDLVKLESSLYRDIKAVSTALMKLASVPIKESAVQVVTLGATLMGVHGTVNSIPWVGDNEVKTKRFSLEVDVAQARLQEQFTLVPSFQTCYVARLYYCRVMVKFTNGDSGFIHVPVFVEKD